jgi:hypothetical protein
MAKLEATSAKDSSKGCACIDLSHPIEERHKLPEIDSNENSHYAHKADNCTFVLHICCFLKVSCDNFGGHNVFLYDSYP